MNGKIDPSECPKCMPKWYATFGDLMSLLLCFFVLLLSMSSMDMRKVENAIGSLAGALSVLEGGSRTELSKQKQQDDKIIQKDDQSSSSSPSEAIKKIQKSMQEVNEVLQAVGSPKVTFKESEDGFIIQLPASLLFQPNSVKITSDDALLFIRRMALIIERLPKNLMIDTIGFTDNLPLPANSEFKNKWELSFLRALSVADELIKAKVNPERIIVSGRSQYDPIASNATKEGREKNRRVELHFYSSDGKLEKEARDTVLDTPKKGE